MMAKLLFILTCFTAGCTASKSVQTGQDRTAGTGDQDNANEVGDASLPGASQGDAAAKPTPATPGETSPAPATALEAGSLNVPWFAGAANCNQDNNPPIQVHAYNKNLTILRQNKCTNFEAPFIHLIFGAQKALLIDSGATASAATFPIRTMVENLMVEHYGAAQRAQITLVVTHSHAHGDHRAADPQFNGQPGTVVVGPGQAAVSTFFGIANWPDSVVDYDLGGRIIKVVPIPGHEASHLAYFDAQTGILFTGDTLYPGRLYIADWNVYQASVTRLRTFADGKNVSHVLGAHVEISKTPGQDFTAGATFQPNEHVLQLSKDALILLDNELKKIGATPTRKVLDEFIITPLGG